MKHISSNFPHVLVKVLFAFLIIISTFWSSSAIAATKSVVIVMNPPTSETNLFWNGIGEKLPSMQGLVGQNPLSGKYDSSELAKDWSANSNFTEWTFRLHTNAVFHFGWGRVTAHDVVHSYKLHTGPDSTIVALNQLRAQSVAATDDFTVVFKFDKPRTDYAFMHAGRGAMVIYSKAQFEKEGLAGYLRKPAGTASYQYVSRAIGSNVSFEVVQNHWQGVKPDFDKLTIRYVAEPATKLALLLSGEAHIADIPRELQAQAMRVGKKIISSKNPAMQSAVAFKGVYNRTGDPAFKADLPWGDIRIREAMNRAIDRKQMINVLYEGRAEQVVRWGMHPPHEGWAPDLVKQFEAKYGYDPKLARELLAQAGYPASFKDPVIRIVVTNLSGNPEFPTMAELLQDYFQKIGLKTEMIEMDWAALGTLSRARKDYLIAPLRNAPIRPTEASLVNFFTTRGTPYGGFEDDRIENLSNELEKTIDPTARTLLAREAWTYLFNAYSDIPLAAVFAEMTIEPKVVADWTFPGVTTNSISHYHLIKAAR